MRRSTRSGSIGRSLTTESPGRPWIRRARTTTPAGRARGRACRRRDLADRASSGSRPRPRIAARCWSAGTVGLSSTVSEPPSSVISSASFASGMAGRRGDLTAMPGGFHRSRTATTVRACVFADGYRTVVREAQSADERGRHDVSGGGAPARRRVVARARRTARAAEHRVGPQGDVGEGRRVVRRQRVEQRRDEAGLSAGPRSAPAGSRARSSRPPAAWPRWCRRRTRCSGPSPCSPDAARADDRVAGALVRERGHVGHHPLARGPEGLCGLPPGLCSNALEPPPPPAVAVNGAGYSCRSRRPGRRSSCRCRA